MCEEHYNTLVIFYFHDVRKCTSNYILTLWYYISVIVLSLHFWCCYSISVTVGAMSMSVLVSLQYLHHCTITALPYAQLQHLL